jgi:SAM-dependent methyltransferase
MSAKAPADGVKVARAAAYENSRPELRRLVPRGSRRVLDLGCASGVVGAALADELGAEVVGVERDPGYARVAAGRLARLVEADVEELAAHDALAAEFGSFDCLLAGDVLEHLRDPETVLRRFADLLEPGGTAIVSLPNVRYWETFWQLAVRGTWPRRAVGIFDRDHLRWFTVGDGIALVESAGLEPRQIERQFRLTPNGSRFDRYAPVLGRTPLRPFFVFQFAIVATRR